MNFEELNNTIPYVKGGKEKILRYSPYPNVTIAMPGRHALQTKPVGGDFVVMVEDPALLYSEMQFKHDDIFKDVELRKYSSSSHDKDLMKAYLKVIQGEDPDKLEIPVGTGVGTAIERNTFLHAVQCLAVVEHRRYAQHEEKFGGRYLPFRFSAGIDEALWSPEDAIATQRRGRLGVEYLEKQYGTPALTKELMG